MLNFMWVVTKLYSIDAILCITRVLLWKNLTDLITKKMHVEQDQFFSLGEGGGEFGSDQ